jgi:HD-GYP domain-containing protein (c-di-GMP phosphodiesterase class II)
MTQRVARSLTMLRVFVLVSAVLLAVGAFALGLILTRAMRAQAVENAEVSLTQYTNGVLRNQLVRDGRVVVGRDLPEFLNRELDARPDLVSVKVWTPDGVLAWTNVAPERIGRRYAVEGSHLAEVLESGKAEAELESLGHEEDEVESKLGVDHVLEVYAPILGRGDRVIGAYEIYADSSSVEASIAEHKRVIWMATAAVFAALWALLVLLVRGASRTLRRQTDALRERSRALLESYRRLEQSSLEAIETLNATVDAKDPYTAGHSQRVQRVAVAVGEELGLTGDRLDALRFGGLLHDIGKLAVPDAILTKPDRLTADEFELIKRHPAEGSRIVGRLGGLRDAVPVIHNHHERWDGTGYPDGLAGDDIPLEGAIVALADAWDAMTTDRPYHRALTTSEAFAEIRAGRGAQFAPVVVDAFFAAVKRRPGDFRLAEEPELLASAG